MSTPLNILILDDDSFALKLLPFQLRNCEHGERPIGAIHRCTCGEQALTQLRQTPAIDLLFCDLQMPGMDGIEFLRHLPGTGFAGQLVLLSGVDPRIMHTARRLAQALGLRLIDAVSKPVRTEQLRRLLNAVGGPRSGGATVAARIDAADLQRGIQAGELRNYYQPQVELDSGRISGFEALVRWQHPQYGLLGPDRFIALAENDTLIDELAQTVIVAATRELAQWHALDPAMQVSINVSMANLRRLDFPDWLAAQAAAAGLAPAALNLEVTESQLMADHCAQLDILARVRLKRIGLSIDDFGTGYSSLAQLRDLPFDELKIDAGFVNGASSDPALRIFLDNCLLLGRRLGMRTVAEGVESRADWELLRGSGCDLAQGYFVARPMPAEQVAAWLQQWQQRRRELAA